MEQQAIGKYQILDSIAAGGQGSVYRAFDPQSGQILALKVLLPGLTSDATYLERFRREASIAASINHPNVVKIFEIGEAGKQHFIAMEFLPESLGRIIEAGGQLPIERVVEFSLQIAQGLAAAHALGIVHRDIKPQNVLIGPSGEAKVTDFGIARAEQLSAMTATGALIGTPYYMSPEQAVGNPVDARSDVYSFGCVMYQMITGELPFRGSTPLEVLRKHREEAPHSVGDSRKDVPAGLALVVNRCLLKNTKDRFQDASQVVSALRRWSSSPTMTNVYPSVVSASIPPSEITEKDSEVAPVIVRERGQPPPEVSPEVSNDADPSKVEEVTPESEMLSRAFQHPATIMPLTVAAACAIFMVIYPVGFLPISLMVSLLIISGLVGVVSFCWNYFFR